jgi:hypothetical protein
MFGYTGVPLLGISPLFAHKGDACQAHFQIGLKFVFRQVTLKPPTLVTCGVHDKYGRRPDRVEAVKVLRIFLDVDLERNKIVVDKRRQTGVVVRLVFEPLTSTSGGRGAEIDQ